MKRSIPVCIILSLITCGLYGIYWFIILTDDLNAITNTSDDTGGGLAFILSLVTCGIYSLYWSYKQGSKIDAYKQGMGIPSSNTGILFLVLSLLSFHIITYALIQNEVNNYSA